MPPFFQKHQREEFKCICGACLCISTYSVSQYTWNMRRMSLFAGQTFAERLPGVAVGLVLLDLAVKDVETILTKNFPSVQESQPS